MVATPIRTAVVGFGVSGKVFHAPLIAANPDFSLDAIVTANTERAAEAARLYPDTRVLPTVDELFVSADDFDLVVICTPPSTHLALASAAIAHGLHLVVDKPFVPTSQEGEHLLDLASRAGVQLSVFQNRRWDADFLTLQRLVRGGDLGQVHSFESRFEWWRPEGFGNWRDGATPAQGGGLLHDLGAHLIDQAIRLFGPVLDTYGETANHGPNPDGGESEAFVSLLHESGVRSRLWMNGVAARPGPRFHVLGSSAGYTKWGLDRQEPDLAAGVLPSDPAYGVENEDAWGILGTGSTATPVPAERGAYPRFYANLAGSIRGTGPLPVDPRESLEVLRIIENIHAGIQGLS
ncbi:Gfo/Idh/MocA family protein [Paenarthrobacter ureafaciens]|uniref:Gfo/Idh/MocA family protein n=1 Tax=Paenarthrobacter ureafaciens TaxID=37931 RepID=UPI002DBFAE4C|nr:Gfo/Idh/MocA family oxidoreductase [Paenarthrobacter ureafaciens]MEC3852742.1 Gfo/Idh/MocA family oxidoreductase [Paenarthrobacter ureafaciens]